MKYSKNLLMAACLGSFSWSAQASVVDGAGDYMPGYLANSTAAYAALDIISAGVTYDTVRDVFQFKSVSRANISTLPSTGGSFVWGINRGTGTAGFGVSLGLTNVLWDATVTFTTTGNGTYRLGSGPSSALPSGTVMISGNTIFAEISGSLLPSTGFNKTAYTWNLWPRDLAVTGLNSITDFAPNAVNAHVDVVPVPGAVWLMGSALGFLGVLRKRK